MENGLLTPDQSLRGADWWSQGALFLPMLDSIKKCGFNEDRTIKVCVSCSRQCLVGPLHLARELLGNRKEKSYPGELSSPSKQINDYFSGPPSI